MLKKLHIQHWKLITLFLMIYDVLAVMASYFLALWFRFDCKYSAIPEEYFQPYLRFTPIYAILCVVIFIAFKLYRTIWRFASYSDLIRMILATIVAFAVNVVGITFMFRRMPITFYVFGIVLQFFFTAGMRFMYRFLLLIRGRKIEEGFEEETKKRVMVIGAGNAGQMILRDVNYATELNEKVYCFIDDNKNKWNRYIDGVMVAGGRDDIMSSVQKYHIDKIYVAIPSASVADKREILNICKETGCELKNLPGMYQFRNGEVNVAAMKDVAVEDLLGRDPITVNMGEVFAQLQDKVIMVTGGGGSIGSELCRQVAAHNPKQLIIFEIYENNAYDIQQELKKKYPQLNLVTLIGSVRDSRRLRQVFETYKPDIVYHAAAHKHVPLMEDSPCESIKNNVIGTYKTAYEAMLNGTKKFVLISTDKAVNPTNIMGASKRLCEMVIQTFDKYVKTGKYLNMPIMAEHEAASSLETSERLNGFKPVTEYAAVRFGNVLGSNGSVIPLFKKQIEAGGPVTVTHPDIIRYFMTIPEAVSLVLQAGTYAKGGEIFILDMGEPVRIDTLARNLIKLSGHKPDVDIKVEYTGLRPGEKLYEEKLMAEEGLKTTENKLIHIGMPLEFDSDEFVKSVRALETMAYANDEENIRSLVMNVTGTYKPAKNC